MTDRRQIFLTGVVLLLESVWAYALVAVAVAVTEVDTGPTYPGVAAVVVMSFALSRYLQSSDLSLKQVRVLGPLFSILVIATVVRLEYAGDLRLWDLTWVFDLLLETGPAVRTGSALFLGVPLLAAFWVRGLLRGQEPTESEAVAGTFIAGIVVLAAATLFADAGGSMSQDIKLLAVPYVVLGLLAVGAAHASRTKGEPAASLLAGTALASGVAVVGLGLVVLAAVGFILLIGFDTAQASLVLVGRGIGIILAALVYVASFPILLAVQMFGSGIDTGGERIESPCSKEPAPPECLQAPPAGDFPWLILLIVLITTLVIGTVVLSLLIAMVKELRNRRLARRDGLREAIYTKGRTAPDLGNLFSSILGRFGGRPRVHDPSEPVRRLYFDMLAEGRKHGVERQPTETPLELAPRLSSTLGLHPSSEITQLFDDVRYGEIPPDPDEVRRLREEWRSRPQD